MSESRKRKGKSYYKQGGNSKWRRRNEELRPGLKGFIITCNDKENIAVSEGYRLLNEYADKMYGPEKTEHDSDSDETEDNIEEALKKQVEDIKNSQKNDAERRFKSLQNKAKNVIFIKTLLPDPAELVLNIFSDLQSTQTKKTRFCLRLLPVINTCYAKPDEIVKTATPLIEEIFHQSSTPFTFHIMWKTRCNNTIKREDVLSQLVNIIYSKDCGHSTDYNTPEYVFNIDIIGNVCCFGFLKSFHFYKKYNLDSICQASNSSIEKKVKVDDDKSIKDIKTIDHDNSVEEKTVPTELEMVDNSPGDINVENGEKSVTVKEEAGSNLTTNTISEVSEDIAVENKKIPVKLEEKTDLLSKASNKIQGDGAMENNEISVELKDEI